MTKKGNSPNLDATKLKTFSGVEKLLNDIFEAVTFSSKSSSCWRQDEAGFIQVQHSDALEAAHENDPGRWALLIGQYPVLSNERAAVNPFVL